MTRALSTLVGAALAGGLIWVAAQMNADTVGGFWAEMGLLAGAGLGLALARLPDIGVRTLVPSLQTLVLAFLPTLIAGGWVVTAAQPHSNWARSHVRSWSGDIGLTRVLNDMRPLAIVLAFGIGVVLGLVFERRAPVTRPVEEPLPATRPVERDAEPTVVERPGDDRELVGVSR